MNKLNITKTAERILIISVSATLGAFIFSYFAFINEMPVYNLIAKIGIRLLVIGVTVAATYDILSRKK